MKSFGIIALSLATLAVAAPAPHRQAKRDLVWVTETSEVVETVVATTTVYVDAEDVTTTVDAPKYTHTAVPTSVEEAATTEAPATSEKPATSEHPATTAAPTTTEKAPEPTTESSSSSEYVAPKPTTSETPSSTYVAPTSTYVAPSSTYVAPTSETYVAPSSSTSAAPAETSAAAKDLVAAESTSSGEVYTPSRITYYSPSVGTSFCGPTWSDDSNVVALSAGSMTSDLCNKQITIEVNGNQFPAFIGEKCPGCPNDGSLDITPTLFTKMMGSTDAGVITNAKWWYN